MGDLDGSERQNGKRISEGHCDEQSNAETCSIMAYAA
jgi:hypothetical protein